jgi:hypothetical protein
MKNYIILFFLFLSSFSFSAENLTIRISIVDNDLPPNMNLQDLQVNENEGSVQCLLEFDSISEVLTTVDYYTYNGTAIAGEDYESTSGTLVFSPGETKKTILVNILNDEIKEDRSEFFSIYLNDKEGNVRLNKDFFNVILMDDEKLKPVKIQKIIVQ